MFKRTLLSLIIGFSVMTLTSCDKPNEPSQVSQQAGEITFEKLINATYSFSTSPVSKNISDNMYVFFDPQCPHCTQLWLNAKEDINKDLPIVWIPVAVLNQNSIQQAAAILAATDPVEAMNKHEALRKEEKIGIEASMINPKFYEQVKINNAQFDITKATGVPLILKQSKDGTIKAASGELTPQILNDFYYEKVKNPQ